MNGRRLAGAIGGGLFAGLALTAMTMAQEKKTGKPSELTDLERAGAAKLNAGTSPSAGPPDAREQAIAQGGHLLLSALAGAAYATTTDEDADVLRSGVAFGLAFYAASHWVTGPALGLKQPEWKSDLPTIGMHTMNHVLFGLATAFGAKLASASGQRSGTRIEDRA